MSDRNLNFGISLTATGGAAAAAETEKVKASLAGIGTAAEQANRKVAQSAGQTAFAMRMLPAQMTDIAVGLSTGQSPFMVLMQQGGQLKDMFGGIGPAISAVGAYVADMVNPFTLAAAGASAFGYVLYESLRKPEEPVKDLKSAVGDLASAIGEVGKTSRDFSMDNLYKEFNKASAAAREGIVEHLRFQQVMIETQVSMAQKSLSKSLDGIGDYSFIDKMKGAFAEAGSDKFAREMGVSLDAARAMLPAIKGLRSGTEDAGLFMARFGTELAKSSNGSAQQLLADIRAVAANSKDAAAAQSRLSEALQKMKTAGGSGQIEIKSNAKAVHADLRALQDYQARIAADVGRLIEDSDIVRAADFAAKIDYLDKLFFESGLDAGTYASALDRLTKSKDDSAAATRRLADEERASQALIGMTAAGKVNALAEQQDRAAKLLTDGRISFEGYDQIINQLGGIRSAGQDTFSELTRAVDGWGKGAASAFVDFAFTGKNSFGDLVASMLREAAKMMVYESLFKPLFGMLGESFKSVMPAFGGGRASGGAVYPGSFYRVNEVAPELLSVGGMDYLMMGGASGHVTPLSSTGGVSGTVITNRAVATAGASGSGGQVVVNVIESPGNGGKTEQRQQGGVSFIDVFVEQVKRSIAGDISDGRGAVPAAMTSAYGLNRAPGAY
jgi:hypothetical protein